MTLTLHIINHLGSPIITKHRHSTTLPATAWDQHTATATGLQLILSRLLNLVTDLAIHTRDLALTLENPFLMKPY